jgi:membrane associated rhomboid family serine protease
MENSNHLPAHDLPHWLALPVDFHIGNPAGVFSRRQIRRWGLVLESRGIRFHSQPVADGWQLRIDPTDFMRALVELRRYEELNRDWPPRRHQPDTAEDGSLTSLCILLLLACFFNLTQLQVNLAGHNPVHWTELGNAHAGEILDGHWWRTLTALTLHADWLHLFGNLVLGGLFIQRLCQYLGAGLGWALVLASGALGNLGNALLQSPDHRAVGASTAVFGAVGILAAIGVLRKRQSLRPRWTLPVAAALALLALLGSSGERTDLGGHLFGFICGFSLGLPTEVLLHRFGRPGNALNRGLAVLCIALISSAWWLALHQ